MGKLLYVGVPFTSLFLITGSVTDPVNVTKFLVLGGVGFAALLLVGSRGLKSAILASRTTVILVGLFMAFSVLSISTSNSPFVQNLYGVYGRNTGFFTYLFLTGLLLGALTLRSTKSFEGLLRGLFLTGLVNVFYCGWVIFFGDFIGWNNSYGNILGLFGNPNFIGAFLGIWISATIGFLIGTKLLFWQKLLFALLLLLSFYEVHKTHAVQGVVVSAAGIATVGFFLIRSRTKGITSLALYCSAVFFLAALALLGALQKGPFVELIYKRSVSLRGSYWNAGLTTGFNHPFTGVGMDGYGDWYRRSRSIHAATEMPGASVVTNSAHNVLIDIFSYGGIPLFLSYFGILLVGAVAILRGIRKSRAYDPIFVALSVAWIGYQLQSFISINQIGLAVWGWVLTGALVAYEASQRLAPLQNIEAGNKPSRRSVRTKQGEVISSPLIAGLGLVVGLILACPPISADMAWFKATNLGNLVEVEKALKPSYLRPQSSERLVNFVAILENSQFFDKAHEYAIKATAYNPENFDSWNALYSVRNSTPEEKELALKNMKRLDPNNPDVTKR